MPKSWVKHVVHDVVPLGPPVKPTAAGLKSELIERRAGNPLGAHEDGVLPGLSLERTTGFEPATLTLAR
jgi:hypothetical protein